MMMSGGLISRSLGLFALIPTTVLLTISFFVLLVVSNIEKKGLKAFGYVVAALLWASALLVFSAGIYTLSTGRHHGMCMMQGAMMGKMSMMPSGPMPMMMHHGPMSQTETKK